MAWNGSGTFTRNQDWTADRDAGNPDNIISADKMDDEFDNYKTGIENTLTRDGQNSPSANLPMNAKKHTNVAIASALTEYARSSQIQDETIVYCGTSSGTDTITATVPLSGSFDTAGQRVTFKAGGTNTGAATFNAVTIQKNGQALVAGDITTGDMVTLLHDGTNAQMTSPARTPVLTDDSIAGTKLADEELTAIGGLTSAANKVPYFTGSGTADVLDFLDEDDMSSDSDTAVASQQSIKNYVDSNTQGKILQVVSVSKTDAFSGTSTTPADITGLSASITPSSTSSKIMIQVHVSVGRATGSRMYFIIDRGGTDIGIGDAAGSRQRVSFAVGDDGSQGMDTTGMNYVDSPNTTSATTYKIQYQIDSGTLFVNRTSTDTDAASYGRAISTITLIEIGP